MQKQGRKKEIDGEWILGGFILVGQMSIHREGFICLGLEFQGINQQCFVEDVSFLCQVPSLLLQYEAPSLSNYPLYPVPTLEAGKATT